MFPHNIVEKWIENLDIEVETISVGRSFMKHHTKYKDTYLKYAQFRTLHLNILYHCKTVKDANQGNQKLALQRKKQMFLIVISQKNYGLRLMSG